MRKYKLKCVHCNDEVERDKPVAEPSCFNCKVERQAKASRLRKLRIAQAIK